MSSRFIRNQKDFYSGLLFTVFGIGIIWLARDYGFGTARRMGPGYFPMVLASVLVVIGLVIAVRGIATTDAPIKGFTPGGLFLVVIATLLFGLLVRTAGLAVATPILVAVSAFASKRFKLKHTLVLAIGLTLFCIVIFVTALGLPMPVLGPWFGR